MFLHTRLFSGPPAAATLVLGLVFAGGMALGAALRAGPASVSATIPAPPPPALPMETLVAGAHPVEVLRVNDGDTFEARVHIWPGMQVTTKVRLRGIDAAELRAACAEEYRLATAARDALQRLLDEGGVSVFGIGPDKYGGRVVASAATRRTPDISAALLQGGLVRAYDGGRRRSWCDDASLR